MIHIACHNFTNVMNIHWVFIQLNTVRNKIKIKEIQKKFVVKKVQCEP